jgi:UDP-N-acetylmuramate dehydrogenase
VSGRADQGLAQAIEQLVGHFGDRAEPDADLGAVSTYRVGGPAALLVEAHHLDDLVVLHRAGVGGPVPLLVVGNGSNLLVADGGFAGVAVRLAGAFAHLDLDVETGRVRAGGAALLPVVARRTAALGLRGFEWAVGVPGSVGGAVRMNAGGHGSDMAASLVGAGVFSAAEGQIQDLALDALRLGYRRSALRSDQVVLWADLQLARGDAPEAEALVGDVVRWRRENQPGGANAGSVFTNPPGDSAGRLIDRAGAKGRSRGGATISPKHANFIQVLPGATADDVFGLMVEVRDLVWERTGVLLEPETRLIGFPPMRLPAGADAPGDDR